MSILTLTCWPAVALAMSACSASNGESATTMGSATVMGTVEGTPFVVNDAISYVQTGSPPSAGILVSSKPNACADLRDNIDRQNGRFFSIGVYDDPAHTQLTVGDYSIQHATPFPPRSAYFESLVLDAQCKDSSPSGIPSGTGYSGIVTITSVNGTTLIATFDVVLGDSEHVSGTFHPADCPELASSQPGQSSVCDP